MIINRHNYEEFFILYLDNELGSEEKASVELFVQENPDLEEEFSLLQQTRFVADTAVVFGAKEELMRPAGDPVTMDNYEEWLLLYLDNELTTTQRAAVENFAVSHPAVKEELEILQKTKLQPEAAIVFPFKETLYRREETARVVTIRWWRIAAAAAVLFAVSLAGYYIFNKKPAETIQLAQGGPKTEVQQPRTSGKDDDGPIIITNSKSVVADPVKEQKNLPPQAIPKNAVAGNQKTRGNSPVPVKENELPVIAKEDDKNRNNLPQPAYNPNMSKPIEQSDAIAHNGFTQKSLTTLKENNQDFPVTSGTPQTFIHTGSKSIKEDDPAVVQSDKKTKFRGLLRKITRTFEKTTNIKATDDDDRLLVAGLAISL
jgi:hypothetical protein